MSGKLAIGVGIAVLQGEYRTNHFDTHAMPRRHPPANACTLLNR